VTNPLTTKQFGDAAEHYVIALLGFSGIPCAKMPDNWRDYDLVAQPAIGGPKTISVKLRSLTPGNLMNFKISDVFDFVAFVLHCPETKALRVFIVSRETAIARMRAYHYKTNAADVYEVAVKKVAELFAEFENNFALAA
jgi:hypothetical protein